MCSRIFNGTLGLFQCEERAAYFVFSHLYVQSVLHNLAGVETCFWSYQKSQSDEIMIFRITIFGIFRFPNEKYFEFFFINSS